jgi:hypothetical protein
MIVLTLFVLIPHNISPSEDATILYRYSENLASTGVISFNTHGEPCEGATDFLWMVILSVFNWLGLDPFYVANGLSIVAVMLTVFLLFSLGKIQDRSIFGLILLLVLFMPSTASAVLGFSSMFFGSIICLTIYYYLTNLFVHLFLSGLFLCLIRPDGVVFALPLFIASVVLNKVNRKLLLQQLLLIFVIPGCIYFLWRWNYFGHFLPLPFYVKSCFDRCCYIFNWTSLRMNFLYVFGLFFPLTSFVCFSLVQVREEKKKLVAVFISVVLIPFLFYSSMMLSQNVCFRFQYPLGLSILAIAVYLGLFTQKYLRIGVLISIIQLGCFLPYSARTWARLLSVPSQQMVSLGKGLREISVDGTLLTSEAGRLPYYSQWKSVDAWGLNTPEYAIGLFQPEDVARINPDLIMISSGDNDFNFFKNNQNLPVYSKRSASGLIKNIAKGTNLQEYKLYLIPAVNVETTGFLLEKWYDLETMVNLGSPYKGNKYCFLLKKSFPKFKEVEELFILHKGVALDF